MRFDIPPIFLPIVSLLLIAALTLSALGAEISRASEYSVHSAFLNLGRDNGHASKSFRRIASFPVFLNTDIDTETLAEIVSVSADGDTLVYTDGATGNLGFVDITNPFRPKAAGVVAVGGEPTSVAVAGRFALVVVNTSPSFVAPSGQLVVVDIENRRIEASFDLNGQPDAVAVSPDRRFAAITIENERDEELGDGRPPQPPPGFLVIVKL